MNGIMLKHTVKSLPLVSWSLGSDDDIAAMIAADRRGDIDIRDYWSVGDERVVKLSAMPATNVGETHVEQYAAFVILHEGGDNDGYRFVVGLKDCLLEKGKIDRTKTRPNNDDSFSKMERSYWCDHEFYNAIPSTFRSIFKYNSLFCEGFNRSTTDYVWTISIFTLPAEKEIRGTTSYANTGERDHTFQLDYYKTSTNRIKYLGMGSTTKVIYWLRTASYKTDHVNFACISTSGTATFDQAIVGTYGLAPMGVI